MSSENRINTNILKDRQIIKAARVMSMIFTPFYLPLLGLVILFLFSYMSLLPFSYKLTVILFVYLLTILLPTFLIHLYRKHQGWKAIDLRRKERRIVPYIISIVCYFFCIYIMNRFHVPRFISIIVVAALVVQMICALINVWWKISTHSAAIGGVAGALLAFAEIFTYDPTWWLCLVLIIAGAVCSSRMILRQHSLSQVTAGFFVGLICAFIVI
ncbi:MAG: phosphatase PAP2 family protein [Prevotella sp.]|jgi:membrane-associated phospholipid phosphatase|nr:phosphatase PAP2 family protein [Prevotella sp.]MCH3994762.1 phosphatase PAP2 family protein [Prevotella sp.]